MKLYDWLFALVSLLINPNILKVFVDKNDILYNK